MGGGDLLKVKQHAQRYDRDEREDGEDEGGHHDVGIRDVQERLGRCGIRHDWLRK